MIWSDLTTDLDLFRVALHRSLRQDAAPLAGPVRRHPMPRTSLKSDELASIVARREVLRAELAALDERARAMEIAARDAGRQTLMTALERVRIAEIDKADA